MTDFEQIYKDYFRDVFLYVRRLSGGDERLAEDITSEAFFRALRALTAFGGIATSGCGCVRSQRIVTIPI